MLLPRVYRKLHPPLSLFASTGLAGCAVPLVANPSTSLPIASTQGLTQPRPQLLTETCSSRFKALPRQDERDKVTTSRGHAPAFYATAVAPEYVSTQGSARGHGPEDEHSHKFLTQKADFLGTSWKTGEVSFDNPLIKQLLDIHRLR